MVQHIFKKENHEGLKERLEVIKYNDELRSMDGDDSQRDEEIFKKSFSNLHISGVSSSYSISNDYDRSDNYPKNQNVDHRRNIQGEDGGDRAFRRENKRQGRKGSNFGHKTHH
jgi:hypothetical protein